VPFSDAGLVELLHETALAVRAALEDVDDWGPAGLDGGHRGQHLSDLAADAAALEVSAIDSFPSVTDAPERSLAIVSRIEVSLARVFLGQEQLCDVLDQCLAVSRYLLENAETWLGDREA